MAARKRAEESLEESRDTVLTASVEPGVDPREEEVGEEEETATPTAWDDETGRRHFRLADETELTVRLPNVEEQTQGDWEYSRVYVMALQQGLLTRKEWEKIIADRALITYEGDKQTIINRIREIAMELQEEELSESRRETLTQESRDLQQRFQQVQLEEQEYFSNTAEHKADQARLVLLASLCTEDAEGHRVWSHVNELKLEKRSDVVTTVLSHFMALAYGLPPDALQ